MAAQQEKVHIVVGKDMQQGSMVLKWTLNRWSLQPVLFVILHVTIKSKDFVSTPIGILPVSSANKEMLEVLRAKEKESADKVSRKYLALCSKVKAQVMTIERFDESLDKIIISLISDLKIKKLVMGVTMIKSLSWKHKTDINVAHSVHKLKPEQCELLVVHREKLLFFKEESNEGGYVEDEHGTMVADFRKMSKEKGLKGFLGKIFTDDANGNTNNGYSIQLSPHSDVNLPETNNNCKDKFEEVQNYVCSLQAMHKQEGEEENENSMLISSQSQPKCSSTVIEVEDLQRTSKEALAEKIKQARKMVQEKHTEAKENAERRSKAEWAISICNQKAEEIEAQLSEERAKQDHLKEELESMRRQLSEVSEDIMERKSKLKTARQQESELRMRLEEHTLEKSWAEVQLGKALNEQAEMERKVEGVRRRRDMARRKVEHCRQRELAKLWQQHYREFTADEISEATGGFSANMAVGVGENSMVYRAKVCHVEVAIKFKTELSTMAASEFKGEVELLGRIRHPNILHVIGACEERRCVVFEFATHGSLRDALLAARVALPWHARVRIAAEVASALGFLHSARSAHGRLRVSCVLLDRHLSAKLAGLRPSSSSSSSPHAAAADVAALGELILQLLTGKEAVAAEEVQEAMGGSGGGDVMGVVDGAAGDWPADLAAEFAGIGVRCAAGAGEGGGATAEIARELEELKERAEERRTTGSGGGQQNEEPAVDPPNAFVCPIFQEVMKQPHVAADGFSYELEAIKAWLESGHDTSPMTNLKLKHTRLTPNHTLRSFISHWHHKIPAA